MLVLLTHMWIVTFHNAEVVVTLMEGVLSFINNAIPMGIILTIPLILHAS
jgi:hypothetical protein